MCLQHINRLNYQNKNSFPEQLIILFNKSITADKNNGSKYGNFYKKKLRQKSYNPNLAWKTNKISANNPLSSQQTNIVLFSQWTVRTLTAVVMASVSPGPASAGRAGGARPAPRWTTRRGDVCPTAAATAPGTWRLVSVSVTRDTGASHAP